MARETKNQLRAAIVIEQKLRAEAQRKLQDAEKKIVELKVRLFEAKHQSDMWEVIVACIVKPVCLLKGVERVNDSIIIEVAMNCIMNALCEKRNQQREKIGTADETI